NGPDAISPPVPALVSSADIEDGNYHHVRITWSNTDRRLEVWFDCEKRQSIEIDIIKDIFNGKTEVYWGFTSATGGENNVHRACLSDDIISKDSVYLCKGRSIQLVAGESINENYKWTPNYFLSENNVQAPICSAEESTTYFANYTNKCNEEVIDTFHVEILPVPEIGLIEDIDLCRDVAQQVEIKSTGVSVTWNDDEVGGTFELLNYEGKVKVKSTNECGDDSTEFNVTLVECTCDIWFPNVFTPNDDLVNDKFGHLGECHGLLEYNLSIYNRWGELLFESDNVNEEWDAKVNLKDVPAGVYFWVASWKVENANGTSTELLSGMVEVIR
ncbi:MAG: gliding motility-associated C-terminal domain-containing protein, partial [Bacteroidia bacterium]